MSSRLVLYFSLPFHPAGCPNWYCTGHAALGIDGTVFQVFDPRRLRADFLVSRMPEEDWLFGDGGFWVDRDPASPRYRHVYLYGQPETRRTVVYFAETGVSSGEAARILAAFDAMDLAFLRGELSFRLGRANCASLVAEALATAGLWKPRWGDRVPALLFRRFLAQGDGDLRTGRWDLPDSADFQLQRLCWGLGLAHPLRAMDRIIGRRPGALAHRGGSATPGASPESVCG